VSGSTEFTAAAVLLLAEAVILLLIRINDLSRRIAALEKKEKS
jgi:hypothetical protein